MYLCECNETTKYCIPALVTSHFVTAETCLSDVLARHPFNPCQKRNLAILDWLVEICEMGNSRTRRRWPLKVFTSLFVALTFSRVLIAVKGGRVIN